MSEPPLTVAGILASASSVQDVMQGHAEALRELECRSAELQATLDAAERASLAAKEAEDRLAVWSRAVEACENAAAVLRVVESN